MGFIATASISCGNTAEPNISSFDQQQTQNSEDAIADQQPTHPPSESITNDNADAEYGPLDDEPLSQLEIQLDNWNQWAPMCEGYPSKEFCDDGDSTLFSGLLCSANVEIGCEGVRQAQSSDGRFWRSPRRINQPEPNSFSRDMAMGVLLYLVSTKDKGAAEAWLSWIHDNRICVVDLGSRCALFLYKLCTDDTDGRCVITPGLWAIMNRVWTYLELDLHNEMLGWLETGESVYASEAQSTPAGYQLHLKGVSNYIYQMLGLDLDFVISARQTLLDKQGDNLFFRWLSGEDYDLEARLLRICPSIEPARKYQWAWERDTQEQAWLESSGWDCIFLGNLILSNRN